MVYIGSDLLDFASVRVGLGTFISSWVRVGPEVWAIPDEIDSLPVDVCFGAVDAIT